MCVLFNLHSFLNFANNNFGILVFFIVLLLHLFPFIFLKQLIQYSFTKSLLIISRLLIPFLFPSLLILVFLHILNNWFSIFDQIISTIFLIFIVKKIFYIFSLYSWTRKFFVYFEFL